MKQIHLLMALTALVFFSCNKDNDEDVIVELSTEEMLTQNTWLITDGVVTVNGVIDPDFDSIEDCNKDDTWKFNDAGTYFENPGSQLCWDDEEASEGTWQFMQDQTMIMLDEDSEEMWQIQTLTETPLIMFAEWIDTDDNSTWRMTQTFAVQ